MSQSDQEIEDAIFAAAVAGECERDGPAGGDVESSSGSAASGGVGRPDPAEDDAGESMPRDAIPSTVEDPDAVGRGAGIAPDTLVEEDAPVKEDGGRTVADGDISEEREGRSGGSSRLGDGIDGGDDAGRLPGPRGTGGTRPAGIEVADETDGGTPPSREAATVERANCDRGGADGDPRRPHEEGEEIEPDAHPAVTRVQNAAFKPMDSEEEPECSIGKGEECTAGQNGKAGDASPNESRSAWAPLMFGIASWLPAFYSVAVHVFLSIPNERTLTALRHWRPVAVRVAYGALAASCGGVRLSPGRTGPGDIALIASVVAISAILLLRTRREEVDGPVPPHTSMEGRVVLVTGSNAGIGKCNPSCRPRGERSGPPPDIEGTASTTPEGVIPGAESPSCPPGSTYEAIGFVSGS